MDITVIIEAVVALIVAIVTAFVIPWIKSKTTAQQREDLVAWVKIAVSAAEQLYKDKGAGADKKRYVLDFLNSHGVIIDENAVNAVIEAAVKQLNTEGIVIS